MRILYPKFNKAFFLSFMGEINGREQNIPNVISYFYEKDNNHIAFKENTTIDFATDKRRKLIQNSADMPICCINFPLINGKKKDIWYKKILFNK